MQVLFSRGTRAEKYIAGNLQNSHFEVCLCASRNTPVDIPLTKTTATQNEDALSYYRVRGLYFLAIVFEATINNVSF